MTKKSAIHPFPGDKYSRKIEINGPNEFVHLKILLGHQSDVATEANTGKKVSVLFLHGVGGSSKNWSDQMKDLQRDGITSYSMDLPGHGKSLGAKRHDEHYTFPYLCSAALKTFDYILDEIKDHRKLVVVAHSYGCDIAMNICQKRINTIDGLVLACGGDLEDYDVREDFPYSSFLFSVPLQCYNCIFAPCYRCIWAGVGFYSCSPKRCCCHKGGMSASPATIVRTVSGQIEMKIDFPALTNSNVPLLMVVGEFDQFYKIHRAYDMYSNFKVAHLERVRNAGHMVMIEKPKEFQALLVAFLAQIASNKMTYQLGKRSLSNLIERT